MIKTLFDRMDTWRHLPNYQLERRADIFFSLYLQPVLKAKFSIDISPIIIPEFPVRIGTIYPDIKTDKSYKIDYVCFSKDMEKVIFVELKTEGLSRRQSQDKYLIASQKVGFRALLEGVLKIFEATNSKRKYFYLLEMLEQAGLLNVPPRMYEIIQRDSLQGITAAADEIKILNCPNQAEIVYIQPNGDDSNIISFKQFKEVVETQSDPVSERFACSLEEWANIQAGQAQ